jgi:hypothetical protein
MASNPEVGRIVVQFIQMRFKNLIEILRDLREVENYSTDLSTLLRVFKECQRIVIYILKIP